MLTVVFILCAVIFVCLVLNTVLVITLHRLNNKFAKKHDICAARDSLGETSENSDQ